KCMILFPISVFMSELKAFFESNCSQIYFIFYENFITLESSLKQKGKYPACLFHLSLSTLVSHHCFFPGFFSSLLPQRF
uniref:Uncharacterized protein n=1 Tax=Xiphophorus couchianus TaxID=32473 RepID=A0A3B5M092_9TELE